MALSSTARTLILGDSYTWNSGTHQPSLVTYSFANPATGPNGMTDTSLPWAPFNDAQQGAARQALDAWGSVSGVRFVEVPDTARGDGIDLRFQLAQLGENVAGTTYYPKIGDVSLSIDLYGGDALAQGSYGYLVLLHEIGHGLGLKHPFEYYPTLPSTLDNFDTTVMAYPKQGFATPDSLRAADVEAIQYLYGSQQDEDNFSVHWSWDATLGGIRHQGNDSSQSIAGTALRDIILGLGGNDMLTGNAGDDALYGGDGNDNLYGNAGNDVLYGENGADWLYGHDGTDTLFGGTGNDWLYGGSGADNLFGEAGEDMLYGEDGNDTLAGGDGNDTLNGGAGSDILYGENGNDLLFGLDGDDLLSGGDGNDTLDGNNGNDRLYGGNGDDAISGFAGNDVIYGGPGSNRVNGNDGIDTLATDLFRQQTLLVQTKWSYQTEYDHRSFSGILTGGGEYTVADDIEAVAFFDGRLVFDGNDPAAQVMRLYQAALGRLPDPVGRDGWTDGLSQGASLFSLAQGFLDSEEFQLRFGTPDNAAFVTRTYELALGRAPDAQGMASWMSNLNGGMSRAEMLVGFSESPENRARTDGVLSQGLWDADRQVADLARLYQAALGRAPDVDGLRFWDAQADAGMAVAEIANRFTQSGEFGARFPNASDADFVRLVYQNTLGRPADAMGEAFWLDHLAHDMSRGQVVAGFAGSTEFLQVSHALTENGIAFA